MTNTNRTLELSKKELFFLAVATENHQLLGIDSSLDIDDEHIKNDFNNIKLELEKKQLIKVGKGNNIVIDEFLFVIINACCKPDAYIVVNNTKEKEVYKENHYYISNGAVVFMIKNSDYYEFQIFSEVDELILSIRNNMAVENKVNTVEKIVELPKEILVNVKNMILEKSDKELVYKVFHEYKYSKDDVCDLIELMEKPYIYFSIFINKRVNGELISKNIVLIQSKENLFKIEEKNKEKTVYYKFIPYEYNKIFDELNKIIKNIKE